MRKIECKLSPEHGAVLRDMVEQWISEGFRTPPYTDEQYDIFEWLALDLARPGGYDTKRPCGGR